MVYNITYKDVKIYMSGEKKGLPPALWALFAAFYLVVILAAVRDIPDILLPSAEKTTVTTPVSDKININTATAAQLSLLPGIGEVLAGRIVEYREQHGSFASTEELKEVSGIGDKKWEAIRDYVTV